MPNAGLRFQGAEKTLRASGITPSMLDQSLSKGLLQRFYYNEKLSLMSLLVIISGQSPVKV